MPCLVNNSEWLPIMPKYVVPTPKRPFALKRPVQRQRQAIATFKHSFMAVMHSQPRCQPGCLHFLVGSAHALFKLLGVPTVHTLYFPIELGSALAQADPNRLALVFQELIHLHIDTSSAQTQKDRHLQCAHAVNARWIRTMPL